MEGSHCLVGCGHKVAVYPHTVHTCVEFIAVVGEELEQNMTVDPVNLERMLNKHVFCIIEQCVQVYMYMSPHTHYNVHICRELTSFTVNS